jgi:DNA-binding MarR family transcriptional regulator
MCFVIYKIPFCLLRKGMPQSPKWSFFSNHAWVIILLAREPNQPLRSVAQKIGITERAIQRIVADLEAEGYLTREKKGRQNTYVIHREQRVGHALLADMDLGGMLDLFKEVPNDEAFEDERLLGRWKVGEHGSEVK